MTTAISLLSNNYRICETCFACANSNIEDNNDTNKMEIWCDQYQQYVYAYGVCDSYKNTGEA